MRARTLLLLFLAVILAAGTALLARSWLVAQRARQMAQATRVAPPQPAHSVLIARRNITRGQILRPEDLIWQAWPEGAIDKNYIVQGGSRNAASFAGWVAKNPIAGGEPITEAKIIAPGNRGFLAAVLSPGMRAISIPVTLTSGISGFIFPGDHVDLLLTYPVPVTARGTHYQHKAAETVLRNIRVIGIDQRLQSKEGEAVVAHTATFEVTPKEAEVIALASDIGKVSLTLRSLVPAKGEAPPAATRIAASNDSTKTDSSVADTATYTLDSEISPLLPQSSGNKGADEVSVVTILRGSGKSSESKASEPTPKGS